MGTLFIVRHAQASFLADNYDRLSAVGETQSRLLGEYWAARRLRFDRVCAGPCVRHQHTARLVREAYCSAGISLPEVQVLPAFEEYPAESVMGLGLPLLLERDPRVRELNHAFHSAIGTAARHLAFQRLFESVVGRWAIGELPLPSVETWTAFCRRVDHGLSELLAAGQRGERAAIFTSAGPTAVALQRALDITPERTLQMSWIPHNASWSEFLYSTQGSEDKFTLSSFNCSSHITDPTHLTYR